MSLNFVYAKSLSKLRGTNFKAFILIFLITFSIFVFTSLIDYGILSKYNIMGPLGYWISNKLMLLFGLAFGHFQKLSEAIQGI